MDSYSKFPEIVQMKSTIAVATVNGLREIFSRYGLPELIISDNGPQFIPQKFKSFYDQNGILHRTTTVYKPLTNDQVDRLVCILKNELCQAKTQQSTWYGMWGAGRTVCALQYTEP